MDWIVCLTILLAVFARQGAGLAPPEQIHISYGDQPDQMVVMWSTKDNITSVVHYGENPETMAISTNSTVARMTENSWNALQYIHRVQLDNLKPATKYMYKVTCISTLKTVSSRLYSFTTMDTKTDRPAHFILYGDMGVEGNSTFPRLHQEMVSGKYEAIWHVGDFAYDLHTNGGQVGDEFMRDIENITANIPYMAVPGNHEIEGDFSHYRYRFSTPNTPWPIPLSSMWYSYNVGPVHFISYSSEVYFTYNQDYACGQYDWLLKDLVAANKNRDKQPWIVAMGHRPMYCSNNDGDDCSGRSFGGWVQRGLEDLFHAQGVDLVIEAHEHSYERLYPVYHNQVIGTSYTNPSACVHIISGAAGNKEGNDDWKSNTRPWSAFRHSVKGDNSYGHLEVHNSTHLYWDQVHSVTGKMIDSIWLVQEHHGPFVTGVDCSGKGNHASCHCPWPFHYTTAKICGVVIAVVIIVGVVTYCVLRKRRKDKQRYRKLMIADDDADHSLIP